MERNSIIGTSNLQSKKTFRDFMEEERANQTQERHNERHHVEQRAAVQSSPMSAAVKTPTAIAPIVEQTLTVEAVLSQIDELADAQAKRDYMSTLPADLRSQAATAIKERKAAAEKAKADTELDGLFD
ncbi:hypothetical protein [Deefgea sp. CFH1-16]|uniref:hypothetical protein n=1 Tax=Deefgea sp. CFH1-16 TaxID=2675457 RepID=UPI0015F62FEF|nr:hypothetical protein [Deefgea sp. CFH1-16]